MKRRQERRRIGKMKLECRKTSSTIGQTRRTEPKSDDHEVAVESEWEDDEPVSACVFNLRRTTSRLDKVTPSALTLMMRGEKPESSLKRDVRLEMLSELNEELKRQLILEHEENAPRGRMDPQGKASTEDCIESYRDRFLGDFFGR